MKKNIKNSRWNVQDKINNFCFGGKQNEKKNELLCIFVPPLMCMFEYLNILSLFHVIFREKKNDISVLLFNVFNNKIKMESENGIK